jgi:hypothetical protein
VDAVGADEQVTARGASVGEAGGDRRAVLLDGNAAGAERNVRVADGGAQRIVEIRPVQAVGGRAPARHRYLGKRHLGEEGAALPVPRVHRERNDADGAERVGQPQPVQDLDGVGADRHARTDLAQDAGLFVDVGVEASLTQGQGGGQPANPAARDEDAHRASSPRQGLGYKHPATSTTSA